MGHIFKNQTKKWRRNWSLLTLSMKTWTKWITNFWLIPGLNHLWSTYFIHPMPKLSKCIINNPKLRNFNVTNVEVCDILRILEYLLTLYEYRTAILQEIMIRIRNHGISQGIMSMLTLKLIINWLCKCSLWLCLSSNHQLLSWKKIIPYIGIHHKNSQK